MKTKNKTQIEDLISNKNFRNNQNYFLGNRTKRTIIDNFQMFLDMKDHYVLQWRSQEFKFGISEFSYKNKRKKKRNIYLKLFAMSIIISPLALIAYISFEYLFYFLLFFSPLIYVFFFQKTTAYRDYYLLRDKKYIYFKSKFLYK